MKKIKYSLFLLPALVLLTLAFCFRADKQNEPLLSQAIVEVLENYHYEPKKIDDGFSKVLFQQYLKRLDAGKRFFLRSDIDSLRMHELMLDDEARNGTYAYFEKVNAIHGRRVEKIALWYKDELARPFDFTVRESFDYNEDSSDFLETDEALREFWRKSLKYQVLEKLARKLDIQDKALERKDTMIKTKPYDSLEAESRREVLKTHNDWFARLRKFDRNDKLSMYINCMTEMFDPHTNYFPLQDKENFDIRMSGKLEGIGAQLQEKDGFLKVASIVPGSPSYKQGQLKAGDIILKVAQGAAEPVDVTNMKIDDAIQLIRGKKGTEVRLTVRKPDETVVIIPIIRDVVVMEDSYAKSAVIEMNGKKFGYINLPSFYIDMNDRNGRSCSKDVAIEVEKLKKDKVKGIVLDLRNNGGGSLGDVIDMAGLFIEKGPVSMVTSRGKNTEILSDNDFGRVLWDGPLAIMVNENSASASEILAAAMQDHKRALIIGTPTYGKGTVQKFIDLDDAFSTSASDKLGSLKITIQKFYRINGSTTQLMGVQPDILLPDRYRYLDFGEKESEFSLPSDRIPAASYSIRKDWTAQFEKAKSNSQKRLSDHKIFNEIEKSALKVREQSNKSSFTLHLETYRTELRQSEAENKYLEELVKQVEAMSIKNTGDDNKEIKGDETKTRMRTDWNKTFEKDIYIRETIQVLRDLN